MADADTILTRAQGMDAALGAASNLPFWIDRAIEAHTKANWKGVAGADNFGVYYTAMACWALHRVVMASRESAGKSAVAGPVQSKRTGDVSVTYAILPQPSTVLSVDADFLQTSFGRQYLAYRDTLAVGIAGVY